MDTTIFGKPSCQPIVFEDLFLKEADDYEGENFETEENNFTIEENTLDYKFNFCFLYNNSLLRGIHLVILVHGFQGNSFDVKLLKNIMSILHPEILYMCS